MVDEKKGIYVVEPGLAVSSFIEKLNKLSYKKFPVDEVLNLLRKEALSFEFLEPYVFFSDARYTRNVIHKSPEFEVLVMCWKPGQKSTIREHKNNIGLMQVALGNLQVSYYQEDPTSGAKIVKKINSVDLKQGTVEVVSGVYQIENVFGTDAVSLHVFIPPLSDTDIYDIETNTKRAMSFGYHSIHGKLVGPEDMR